MHAGKCGNEEESRASEGCGDDSVCGWSYVAVVLPRSCGDRQITHPLGLRREYEKRKLQQQP
ncbi:hypothetical protein U1Q18_004339 [Sarracenia purpurea var. burkii]